MISIISSVSVTHIPPTFPWTRKKQSDLAPWWNRHPEPAPNPDSMRRRSGWHLSRSRECGPERSPECDWLAAVSAGTGGAGCQTDTLWCAPPCQDKGTNKSYSTGSFFPLTEFISRRLKWTTDLSRKTWSPFLLFSRKSSLTKEKKDFPGRSATGLEGWKLSLDNIFSCNKPQCQEWQCLSTLFIYILTEPALK